jgi:hypothetical protein
MSSQNLNQIVSTGTRFSVIEIPEIQITDNVCLVEIWEEVKEMYVQ